jgi:hypothetical protein
LQVSHPEGQVQIWSISINPDGQVSVHEFSYKAKGTTQLKQLKLDFLHVKHEEEQARHKFSNE